ncbi:8101_t:CDS:10 [Entrophospora sp. SA101]|nr:14422_t:CDS:10 [Entrophospora sp. SA101]CAJ0639304.1 8101_t:CDS:10 [Entrophospora sp. SA101]
MDRQTTAMKKSASIDEPVFSNSLEDYEIHTNRPIGYGASAVVYGALYKPLNKKVAVKTIDLDFFERNQIDEVRKETQLMSLSKHTNVLKVYCSFVNQSKLYIVTPYMSAAGNLLMDGDGSVLLADFGVASCLTEGGDRKELRKTFVGTPCWMAPEIMEHEGYDYKADIWSFGITALELATGHAPFAKYPPLKVIMMTLSSDPPTLARDETKHKYSKGFKEMIDSLVQQKPITFNKGVTWDFTVDSEDLLNELEENHNKKIVRFMIEAEETSLINAPPKKSRFYVETNPTASDHSTNPTNTPTTTQPSPYVRPQSPVSINSEPIQSPQPQSEGIKKGRFSVIESNSSKEKSIPINELDNNNNGERIPLAREHSNESLSESYKKSRFEIQQTNPQPIVIPLTVSTSSSNESFTQSPTSLSRDSSLKSDSSSSVKEVSQIKNSRFQSDTITIIESSNIEKTEKTGTKKGRFEVSSTSDGTKLMDGSTPPSGNLCSFNAPNSPQSTFLSNSPSALPLASILQGQQLNPTQLISQISFLLQQNDMQRNLLIEMMGLHGNDLEPPSIKPLQTKANQVNNINKSEQLPHITGNIKPKEMSAYLNSFDHQYQAIFCENEDLKKENEDLKKENEGLRKEIANLRKTL